MSLFMANVSSHTFSHFYVLMSHVMKVTLTAPLATALFITCACAYENVISFFAQTALVASLRMGHLALHSSFE